MSGKLPRSTQYGKKIHLPPPALPVPSNNLNGLSPYLGKPVVFEEDSTQKKSAEKYENYLNLNDSTFSSLSDIESWDTGSTSSSSWFDEYDHSSTLKLNKELDDIELVLYSEADISILKPELREECQEWKDAFPHLRITGTSVKYSPIITSKREKSHFKNNPYQQNDIGQKSFSILSTNTGSLLYQNKPTALLNTQKFTKEKNSLPTPPSILDKDLYLRISPISSYERPSPVSSLVRSEITSSKWRRQSSSPEYSSLPYIPVQHTSINFIKTNNSSCRSSAGLETPRKYLEPLHYQQIRKSRTVKSGNYYQTLPPQRSSIKPFCLPPIDQLTINNNDYRSISATPRNNLTRFTCIPQDRRYFETTGAIRKDLEKTKPKSNYK